MTLVPVPIDAVIRESLDTGTVTSQSGPIVRRWTANSFGAVDRRES